MTIKAHKTADLTLDPNNAKRHQPKDIDAIAASLSKFGQVTPIVIKQDGDKKVIIKGNGTYLAAKKLGWESINALETELDGGKLEAYAVADNHTATLSQWNIDKLEQQVRSFDQDLRSVLGFDEEELSQLLSHHAPMPSGTLSLTVPNDADSYSIRIDGIKEKHKDQIAERLNTRLKMSGLPYEAQIH